MVCRIDFPPGAKFRGIEFSTSDPTIPAEYIESQIEIFEKVVKEDVPFEEDDDFGIGWSPLKFVTVDGYLQVREPDFEHMPIRWVNSLDRTFQDFGKQVRAAERLGVWEEFDLPLLSHACLICNRYVRGNEFIMERFPQDGANDSGWYVGCADPTHNHNDPAELGRVSLYEASLSRPGLVNFVGLPMGMKLMIRGEEIVYAEREGRQIHLGSP